MSHEPFYSQTPDPCSHSAMLSASGSEPPRGSAALLPALFEPDLHQLNAGRQPFHDIRPWRSIALTASAAFKAFR